MEKVISNTADYRIRLNGRDPQLIKLAKMLDKLLFNNNMNRNFSTTSCRYSSDNIDNIFGFQFRNRNNKFSFYYNPEVNNNNLVNQLTNDSVIERDENEDSQNWVSFKIYYDKIPENENGLIELAKKIVNVI